MKVRSLQLINAGINANYARSTRTGAFPPLNLAALAAFVGSLNPDVAVEVLDGELLTTEEIIRQLRADVVGISCNVMTYDSALRLAEAASARGSRVILGGPYPSCTAQQILRNRPYVDAAVIGDGELALHRYLNNSSYTEIPNLCYRSQGNIARNTEQSLSLEDLPYPDYLSLPMDRYFEAFIARYQGYKSFKRPVAIYSRKGCVWRDATKSGCIFCVIPNGPTRFKSPQRMWNEISFLHQALGADCFWDVSDTFTESRSWLDDFERLKPRDLEVSFQVYGRPGNLSSGMVQQLRRIGVSEVFLGVESADNTVLAQMNKGTGILQIRRGIELLAAADIRAVISFVLAGPSETSASLRKTVDFARDLRSIGNVVETSSSILLPIPGSVAFDQLLKIEGMRAKHDSDLLDLEELKRDWVRHFTSTSFDEVEAALRELLRLFPLNESFSQVALQSAPMC